MHRLPRWVWISVIVLFTAGCAGTGTDREAERSVEEIYADARNSLSNGNYSEAVRRFENLVARYPFGDHAVQAQLMIIYAHYRAGQYDSSVAAADRFMRMHPRSEHVAYALYMKGVSRQSMGPGGLGGILNVDANLRDPEPKRRAFADFRELTERFPESEYIEDAAERMETIRAALAEHELYVARFYFDRSAYIASANRARTIIARYPGTPAVPEAMELLARSYRGLDLHPLDQDVEEEIRRRHELPVPPLEGGTAAGGLR